MRIDKGPAWDAVSPNAAARSTSPASKTWALCCLWQRVQSIIQLLPYTKRLEKVKKLKYTNARLIEDPQKLTKNKWVDRQQDSCSGGHEVKKDAE